MSSKRERADAFRQFEGSDVLDELLELAGSRYDTDGAWVALSQGFKDGLPAGEVIPTLFDGEPHFPHPDLARRTFGNLLGLWDHLMAGERPQLEGTPIKAPREPRAKPTAAPEPFDTGTPDVAWVDAAWKHLEDDLKARTRLTHVFENRQDALLEALDDEGLGDQGYAVARFLIFELCAFLELGRPGKGRAVDRRALSRPPPEGSAPPPALTAYVEEALLEAADDEEPLSDEEVARIRVLSERALWALWDAYGGDQGPSERTS